MVILCDSPSDRWPEAALLGSPASVEVAELLSGFRGELFCLNMACQLNGQPDLLHVSRTVRAGSEVSFEATTVAARERTLEVVGDELDRLLTHDVLATQ
jgi:hypothetical protein